MNPQGQCPTDFLTRYGFHRRPQGRLESGLSLHRATASRGLGAARLVSTPSVVLSRCGIGLVFEAAAIVGVPLFESDRSRLTTLLVEQEDKLRLLPKAIHKPREEVKDDF